MSAESRKCPACGESFTPQRRSNRFMRADGPIHDGARYCSPGCKQAAYRRRKQAVLAPFQRNKCVEGTTPHRTVTNAPATL